MATNIENMEYQEISKIPVTEKKEGFRAIGIDSQGDEKAYYFDNLYTKDEVDEKFKDKAGVNELNKVEGDVSTLKSTLNSATSSLQSDIQNLENTKLDKSEIGNFQVAIKRYKAEVANISNLPTTGNEEGDGRIVTNDKDSSGSSYIHVWDGTAWSRTPYTKLPSNLVTNRDIAPKATNGLTFAFPARESKEIDAMNIIQDIYLSVTSGSVDMSAGASISALSVRESTQGGYAFAMQLVPGNVSTGNQSIIHLSKRYDILPTNIEEFYMVTDKCKLYVRVDFSKLGLRDIVYNWQTPICKIVNIIDANSQLWDRVSYIAKNVAPKQEVDDINTTLAPIKTTTPTIPAFDFSSTLEHGFYEVSNNKVRVSSIVPAQYRHIRLLAPMDRKMRLNITPYGIVVYGAIYTDVNDTYISRELKGEDKPTNYEDYELNIPNNAVYIYLSGHVTSPLQAYINGLDVVKLSDYNKDKSTTGFETENLGISGDSITSPSNGWTSIVMQKLKFANLHNEAVGSSCWSKRRLSLGGITYETQDYNDPNFAGISSGWQSTTDPVEVQKRANNCSIVHIQKFIKEVEDGNYPIPHRFILAYGTNSDTENGSSTEALEGKLLDNVDLFTMAGAMRWCIQTLLTEYPNLKVFVSLPIQTGKPASNIVLEQKMLIMKDICKGMSIPYFDCYSESGICEKFETSDGTAGKYLRDSLHTNDAGVQVHGNYEVMMLKRYK